MKKQKANDSSKDGLTEENANEILGRLVLSPNEVLKLKYTGLSSG